MSVEDVDEQAQDKPKASKALGFQPSLKGRALRLLSQREHSRQELEQKLKPYEEIPGELAQALDFLQAKDFINDQRVVESVVNRRASKMGAARIQQELRSKGLDDHVMAETLNGLRATETERARDVWRKKFGQPPQDAKERAQQMRYLLSRGFASDTVRRIISQPTEHSD
ncbi:recombination regulator RecX [Limnohabitans planktonicus]|uniref:Regulatory protein RecX n=1 Tax=Limnohabitans planktonicus II-D5 TaxID=1293045 RepID=A0A2T7UIQ7_9BURK|nr:recombination regulator RecX [Limnohabitans planktonicus]PVE44559.1 recombination regulator RecX [Limnohabitans planktonicus II-D5]|eukprot:gene1559-1530_t